jgi:hypothetical protein
VSARGTHFPRSRNEILPGEFAPIDNPPIFGGELCGLRSEVNGRVGRDSFEIGKWEGERHGLSMAIFKY